MHYLHLSSVSVYSIFVKCTKILIKVCLYSILKLIYLVPPRAHIIGAKTLNLTEGERLELSCTVHGYPVPTVHWSKQVSIYCNTVYMYTLYTGLNRILYKVQCKWIPCIYCTLV